MTEPLWADVDRYIEAQLVREDALLRGALERSAAAGLPAIAVSAAQGKQLQLMAQLMHARHILEIGTLGGYSTIWLARALPSDGRLVTLELSEMHAKVARENIAVAGFAAQVEVRVGPALETLPTLVGRAPFDFVFIDADKPNIPGYLDWAIRLSRSGAAIVVDNVVRKGALADEHTKDDAVRGVRAMHETLAHDPRVSATTIQTVGAKGYDGFTLIRVQ